MMFDRVFKGFRGSPFGYLISFFWSNYDQTGVNYDQTGVNYDLDKYKDIIHFIFNTFMKINNLNINRQIVISNKINEARFKMTRAEQKLFLYCVGVVDNQSDVLNTKFKMNVKDFAEFLELKSNKIYDEMIKTTADMASRVIQFATPEGKLHQIPVLAEVIYYKGEVEIEVNRNLAPYLIDLKSNFTKFSLQEVLSFRSVYSMRIYQLLSQWHYQERVSYSVEELRFMLNIDPEEYKLYGDFKRKVLEVAFKEINQSSSLKFTYQEIKTGRKVTDINFIIKKITKPKAEPEVKKSVIADVEPTTSVQALPEVIGSELQLTSEQEPQPKTLPPVHKRLINLGYSSQNSIKLINDYTPEFLEYIFEKSKIEDRQKIINRAGYYGTLIAQYREMYQEELKRLKMEEERAKEYELNRERYEQEKKELEERFVAEQPNLAREILEEEPELFCKYVYGYMQTFVVTINSSFVYEPSFFDNHRVGKSDLNRKIAVDIRNKFLECQSIRDFANLIKYDYAWLFKAVFNSQSILDPEASEYYRKAHNIPKVELPFKV